MDNKIQAIIKVNGKNTFIIYKDLIGDLSIKHINVLKKIIFAHSGSFTGTRRKGTTLVFDKNIPRYNMPKVELTYQTKDIGYLAYKELHFIISTYDCSYYEDEIHEKYNRYIYSEEDVKVAGATVLECQPLLGFFFKERDTSNSASYSGSAFYTLLLKWYKQKISNNTQRIEVLTGTALRYTDNEEVIDFYKANKRWHFISTMGSVSSYRQEMLELNKKYDFIANKGIMDKKASKSGKYRYMLCMYRLRINMR